MEDNCRMYYQVAVLQNLKFGEALVFVDCVIVGNDAFPIRRGLYGS
jgi:hypothetical protein